MKDSELGAGDQSSEVCPAGAIKSQVAQYLVKSFERLRRRNQNLGNTLIPRFAELPDLMIDFSTASPG
jgi:predicted permease